MSVTLLAKVHGRSAGPRARAGTTLVELMVALPLLAVVGALVVAVLLGAHRQARDSDAQQRSTRELRHAALVLAAEMRPLGSADLIAWTDTSVDFDALVGAGIACGTRGPGRALHLLSADADAPAGTAWVSSAETLDEVTAWVAEPDVGGSAARIRGVLDQVMAGNACEGSPLQPAGAPGVTMLLRDSLRSQVAEGTPVRVLRRTRYALYRASDGRWYLGRRSRDAGTWTVIQPVVGPLLSAASRGVSFDVTDEAGNGLVSGAIGAATSAAAVRVGLRARGGPGGRPDSTRVEIALRGHHDP